MPRERRRCPSRWTPPGAPQPIGRTHDTRLCTKCQTRTRKGAWRNALATLSPLENSLRRDVPLRRPYSLTSPREIADDHKRRIAPAVRATKPLRALWWLDRRGGDGVAHRQYCGNVDA